MNRILFALVLSSSCRTLRKTGVVLALPANLVSSSVGVGRHTQTTRSSAVAVEQPATQASKYHSKVQMPGLQKTSFISLSVMDCLSNTLQNPENLKKLSEEWREFKTSMDDALDVRADVEEDLGGGMTREKDKKTCEATVMDASKEICFISGGSNPAIPGDYDHYNSPAWSGLFKGLPNTCKFCGTAGVYKGSPEGTVMIFCPGGHAGVDLKQTCLSKANALHQDSILYRDGGKAALLQTWPTNKKGDKMADASATPRSATNLDDFVSKICKGTGLTFDIS